MGLFCGSVILPCVPSSSGIIGNWNSRGAGGADTSIRMVFCLPRKQRGPDERKQMRKLVLGQGAAAASVQAACLSDPVRLVATARDGRCMAWQVSRVQKMLGDEFGTASNIKSRVNRQSVLGAITSCQQRLKLYNRVRHFAAQNYHIYD